MGDVDKDTAIATMMSMTGSEDFGLLTRLLEENAWCVELAIETYNTIQSTGGGSRSTAGVGAGNNNNNNTNDDNIPVGDDGAPLHTGGGAGGGGGGDDIRVVGDFRQRMAAERNPTNQTFESRTLQNLFKSPEYAEKLGTNGWRGAGEKAAREKKYIILNIQEGSNFWSHRVDRDVWANNSVRNVVLCDFLLVQVWKDGDNYRDIVNAYPDVDKVEFPIIMILDFASRMELKRITYKQLLTHAGLTVSGGGSQASQKNEATQLAMSMVEILTTFVERQQTMNNREPSMDQRESTTMGNNNNNNNNGTNSNSNDNDNTDAAQQQLQNNNIEDDDIAEALRLSQETAANQGSNNNNTRSEDRAIGEQQQQQLPEPQDTIDTLAPYRQEEKSEGIMKLRIKLPLSSGEIVDWDILLPKNTPQRAFTRGVRYEMKTNRSSPVPPRSVIKVTRMDRSRKQVEIFSEDVNDAAKLSSDEGWVSGGTPLADVEGSMRSGDVLWVEFASAA